MIDRSELTPALQRVVSQLVDDLRVRAESVDEVADVVRAEYAAAVEAGRTAHDVETWREGLLAQVAVSWVLGCVFVRFCEDNRLVTEPLLSGRGEWRRWATDAQTEYFRQHRDAGERAFLLNVFEQAAELPGLSDIFGSHNPLWQFGPSDDACRDLIAVWRDIDPESGELVWDFTDETWDTRFLGDLYQDLSEHAKKTFALLQTPEFVEEFILDRTLDPAIEEFGLTGTDGDGFRMIDPACGSGHFLLGGFQRLAERWLERDPAAGRRAAAARALESVYGVDINPFAASIARFRLLVAALRFAEVRTLTEAPVFIINVAVGDSLLHGPAPGRLPGQFDLEEWRADAATHLYVTEDAETVGRVLSLEYHAVVANPPYITPKDPAANQAYRDRYATCHRKYSLSVPFMERLFDLAYRGAGDRRAGFVGQITSNTFMSREFGKPLIEKFLARQVDLTFVIDTKLAEIPGHNQTVILFGRNRAPVGKQIRAVLGIRGERSSPADPSKGAVWGSILHLIDQPGQEDEFVSASTIDRAVLATHPWSLQGGAAGPLRERIESRVGRLAGFVQLVGVFGITGADEVMLAPPDSLLRRQVETQVSRPLVSGDLLRDWAFTSDEHVLFPYDDNGLIEIEDTPGLLRWAWPARTVMGERRTFAKKSYFEEGRPWWEWHQVALERTKPPLSIAFAEVATHNHFVLIEGGSVFAQTAPVIKLSEEASFEDHIALLGLINSSVACFWMRQVCYCKTSAHGGGATSQPDTHMYAFNSSAIKNLPIAAGNVHQWSAVIEQHTRSLAANLPAAIVSRGAPDYGTFAESRVTTTRLRTQRLWVQEELDWRCMYLYGITDVDLSYEPAHEFHLQKGERAFEIALARRVVKGEADTTYFERHDSTPITELPAHWPDWYRERVEQRLALIESDRFVNLLERPEYKRRWNWEPWEKLAEQALRDWLLTRLEDARYWPTPDPRSVAQLADTARADAEFVQVAELYRDSTEVDLVDLVSELAVSDAVPFLAAWRYKDSGLRNRAAWERTWDLQRREDAGEDAGKIPVPPKYKQADFRSATMWKLRGKLDVPKERFISYPGLERDTDATAVFGWAGWDHLDQAKALVALYQHRRDQDGWEPERLTPILAGLTELIPWLRQWHNEIDSDLGLGLGDYFADYLTGETHRNGLAPNDLTNWRPPQTTRRKRTKKASA